MRLVTVATLAASLLALSVSAIVYGAEAPKHNMPNTPNSAKLYPSFLPTPASFKTTAQIALYESPSEEGIVRSKNIRKVIHTHAGIYCIYSTVTLDPANTYPTVT